MIQRRAGLNAWVFTLLVACTVLFSSMASAQLEQLTAEQRRMLDSLPAAQRQQALDAIRRLGDGRNQALSGSRPLSEQNSFEQTAMLPAMPQETGEVGTKAVANARLIISFEPRETLDRAQRLALSEDPVLSRLTGSRTFRLDQSGNLSLLGITAIPLLGLDQSDIERRLAAEPLLEPFAISVRILDTQASGKEALKPFGYEIFEPSDSSFDPPMTGPAPPDYVLGPGDVVRVQLFGNVNGIYEFDITREGVLNLPEIGPVTVAGLTFSELRRDVENRVDEMLIGTQVSVTLGQLRTIRIFVLGDANRPGSYVVSSLATISSALYRSGGISPIGSLRDIQLKRQGETVGRLDLYDLLLQGDTSGDARLRSGDVIFVPPKGNSFSVTGAVKRPAIYEGDVTAAQAIQMAGGLTEEAFPSGARIERINEQRLRTTISLDLRARASGESDLLAGDVLFVPEVLPELEQTITLSGFVHRPGPYQWRSGMRIADLFTSLRDLQQGADFEYVLIRREAPTDKTVSALSVNLRDALANPLSNSNVELQPRDSVLVFNELLGRQRMIEPVLEELEMQAGSGEPFNVVSVNGATKSPGRYPLEPGMRVSDLIRAGGGLSEQAYATTAELVSYEIIGGETRNASVQLVNLADALDGNESADLVLRPHDNLRVSTVQFWNSNVSVSIEGEVRFPGVYRVRQGETLAEVVERAGGLSELAFPEGAVFIREELREREQEQIDQLAQRLEGDLLSLSLESDLSASANGRVVGEQLLSQLRSTRAVGRLVIDLDELLDTGNERAGSFELRAGDRLLVPRVAQEVTVIGEVQKVTSHLYAAELSRSDYIDLSGGLTERANAKKIYVVRANGAVEITRQSRWLRGRNPQGIRPGDTIVVPSEIEKIRPLTLWTNVTQILYQAAIALAAVDSFGN